MGVTLDFSVLKPLVISTTASAPPPVQAIDEDEGEELNRVLEMSKQETERRPTSSYQQMSPPDEDFLSEQSAYPQNEDDEANQIETALRLSEEQQQQSGYPPLFSSAPSSYSSNTQSDLRGWVEGNPFDQTPGFVGMNYYGAGSSAYQQGNGAGYNYNRRDIKEDLFGDVPQSDTEGSIRELKDDGFDEQQLQQALRESENEIRHQASWSSSEFEPEDYQSEFRSSFQWQNSDKDWIENIKGVVGSATQVDYRALWDTIENLSEKLESEGQEERKIRKHKKKKDNKERERETEDTSSVHDVHTGLESISRNIPMLIYYQDDKEVIRLNMETFFTFSATGVTIKCLGFLREVHVTGGNAKSLKEFLKSQEPREVIIFSDMIAIYPKSGNLRQFSYQ